MANDIVSTYSKRTPFRAYIFYLLEKHHIPLPPRDSTINTDQELWGYFIEILYHRCVKKITFLPTNGYTVGDINTTLVNKSFIFTAKYLNVFNNNQFTRDFTISTKGTASISGDNRSVTISVELSDKFYTTQPGIGSVVGGVGTYDTYNLPIQSVLEMFGLTAETPRVGSTVFHENKQQTEIVSIDTFSNTFVGKCVSTNSTDVWFFMWDTRNTLNNHMANYGNPHRVTLTQAELQQSGNPLIVNHNIYLNSNNANNRFITYAEATALAASGGIGLQGKFQSTENGIGAVNTVNTYTRSYVIPYVVGDNLAVGSYVYYNNRYQTIVTSVSSTTYQARTVTTYSSDITFLLWDIQTRVGNLETNYTTLNANKMDKVPSAKVNNFAAFISGGNTRDSGYTNSSFDPAGSAAVVQNDLNNHESTYNPHNITLTIAEVAQGTSNLTVNHDIYRLVETPNNRYITYSEGVNIASTIVQGAPQYMGVIKFGADSVASMNTISTYLPISFNDLCIVQNILSPNTNTTYRWNGSLWVRTTLTTATLGQFYDIIFWFGTWLDNLVYNGNVSARITCRDSATPKWDLIVYTDIVIDDSITTPKIVDNAVTNDKLSDMPSLTIKGNNTTNPSSPIDLTKSELKSMLGYVEASDVPGLTTIGNRMITISKNGVMVNSFTTNESGAVPKDINMIIPIVPSTGSIMKGDTFGNLTDAIPSVDYSIPSDINNSSINIVSTNSALLAPSTPTPIATVNQLTNTTLTLNRIAWTANTNDLIDSSNLIPAYITNQYYDVVGILYITTNKPPIVRRVQNTGGSTISGSWSANGVSFFFTPTTPTDITVNKFILIIY